MSLSALLERVEACQGPDREIDDAIVERMFGKSMLVITEDAGTVWRNHKAPFYTSSVDAALALIGRVLPGWSWSLTVHPSDTPKAARAGWDTVCTIYRLDDDYAVERTSGYFSHKSPALALCAALLAAMIGEEAKP